MGGRRVTGWSLRNPFSSRATEFHGRITLQGLHCCGEEKVAICGKVGSGKSTLLAAIPGEVPHVNGTVQVYGKIAYVSQTAWIPTGTIKENILFGSAMDPYRYREAMEKCTLVKDIEMLPFGDQTEIGERGVNLSGGQKQRVQLARALYQDADVYLLDDPFSEADKAGGILIWPACQGVLVSLFKWWKQLGGLALKLKQAMKI